MSLDNKQNKKTKKKKKVNIVNLVLFLIMLAGGCIIAYPSFADWWNNFHQARSIAKYVEQVAMMDREDFDRIWSDAEAYNVSLLHNSNRLSLSDAEIATYNSILDITGTGIMGYIDIPKINISLPIYHGIDDEVLQTAIGHIPGTSLPVGGIGTHTVLSGHRGLPSAKLFSDIDQLVEGDTFLIQVLDRTLTYEVDQIRIVLPTEMQDLQIDPAQDYCTLVTCTPYGINTHRLLVRGHRIETLAGDARVTADALQLEPVFVAPLVAAPILLILLILLLITTSGKNKKPKIHGKTQAMEAARELTRTIDSDQGSSK